MKLSTITVAALLAASTAVPAHADHRGFCNVMGVRYEQLVANALARWGQVTEAQNRAMETNDAAAIKQLVGPERHVEQTINQLSDGLGLLLVDCAGEYDYNTTQRLNTAYTSLHGLFPRS
jgi:hypothetical protein